MIIYSKENLQFYDIHYPALSFRAKTFNFITGKSGCGKSTYLKMLNGIIQPAKDMIFFNDMPIEAYDILAYRHKVLLVPQNVYLQSGSILDNFVFYYNNREQALPTKDKIKYLSPEFCLTTYILESIIYHKNAVLNIWKQTDIDKALQCGVIHYNGQKPWKGYCVNFDIWWEYYRKSPFFDEKFYFDFFYNKLNEFDCLSLWKRIKILARYFIYGKK